MGIMDSVNAFTKGVGQMAKGNYDVLAMNNQISNIQKEIDAAYKEIGKKYYETHKDDPDTLAPELIAILKKKDEQIEELEREIETTRQATAAVSFTHDTGSEYVHAVSDKVCIKCGAGLAEDAVFCNVCGTKQEAQTVEPEPDSIRLCPGCGNKVDENMIFCGVCGTKLDN